MNESNPPPPSPRVCDESTIEEIYRVDSRRVLATLVRLLGDFDLAEEALHEAFVAATEVWPRDGLPENPRAWLVSTGRFRAVDVLRRRARFDASREQILALQDRIAKSNSTRAHQSIEDDRLRLIFTCCHPAIAPEIQIALTLREVCGLTTEEVASAFLVSTTTMAKRIVRGKAKIRDAGIPFVVPGEDEFAERLESVLAVVYLVFNEGYAASSGRELTRVELSTEAIRLGRLIADLIPDAESTGLLALMLLQESRRAARTSHDGDLILLEDQDRSRWDRAMIDEGLALLRRILVGGEVGPYTIQAAIAAVHASSTSTAATDWGVIVSWYDLLLRCSPSPIVRLNRAVALSLRDGPLAGLAELDALDATKTLAGYHLFPAARADLFRRLGRRDEARAAYESALSLAQLEPERRFLRRRLEQLDQ